MITLCPLERNALLTIVPVFSETSRSVLSPQLKLQYSYYINLLNIIFLYLKATAQNRICAIALLLSLARFFYL